jgi:hypothetical protein
LLLLLRCLGSHEPRFLLDLILDCRLGAFGSLHVLVHSGAALQFGSSNPRSQVRVLAIHCLLQVLHGQLFGGGLLFN